MLNEAIVKFLDQHFIFRTGLVIVIAAYSEYGWRNLGLLEYWWGRGLGLFLLVMMGIYLHHGRELLLPLECCLLALYGTYFLVWFARGYGYTFVNDLPIRPMNVVKQWVLGCLIFFSLITGWLMVPDVINDPGIKQLAARLPKDFLVVMSLILRIGWGLVITEGGWTYSDFRAPYAPFLPGLCLQAMLFIHYFLWGNQLREFITIYLHPNVLVGCVGLCIVTALGGMLHQLGAMALSLIKKGY